MAGPTASRIADALLGYLEPSEVILDADVMMSFVADRATPVVPGTPSWWSEQPGSRACRRSCA
ncbi:MAG: hypothetical protein M5U19_22385 [Microthrixaceae bacterium]|nr:hypothetical protein [Microthrixaceae bacterium]